MARWPMIALLLAAASSSAKARFTEQQVVSYAKALDVAKLDPTLSPQRLDEWLRSGPAHLEAVTWEMSDCDLEAPPPPAPLCVKIRVMRGHAWGWIIVQIGSFRDGMSGAARLRRVIVGSREGITPYSNTSDSEKLSDLPQLLDKVP